MTIIVRGADRVPVHVDPVAHVARVPSRRDAEAAYCRILADLTFNQVDAREADIETVRNFIWSR